MEPLIDVEGLTFDEIVDYYDRQDSDVYAFSSYLWSHVAVMCVAQELKKRNKNRIIVFGGPHLNITYNDLGWFIKNSFIDAICEPTSYGEWFVTDMLDQLVVGEKIDWKEVSFSIYKTGRGKQPYKKDFKFPGPLIEGNEDLVFKCKDLALHKNIPLVLPMETTRGCPYECVFCEWGGGTGSKVVRKTLDDIKADLNQIPVFGIEQIQILDANYGIYLEDEDVSKYIEEIKSLSGLPNYVELYGMTKSKHERKWVTFEPLARSGVIPRYKISLQTLNEQVLKNIKRVNIDPERDFEYADHLLKSYGVRADLEFILGLPGYDKDSFYHELDVQYDHGYTLERYVWMLLPDSPAYDPEYRKKFNIKTTKVCIGRSRMNSYAFDDVKNFELYHIANDYTYKSDVEFVVEADGYTRDEYVEFFFMNYWVIQGFYKLGAISDTSYTDSEFYFDIPTIINENLRLGNIERPSQFFRKIYQNILEKTDNQYADAMREMLKEISDLVYGRTTTLTDFKDFKLPYTNEVAEVNYVLKACVYVFKDDYMRLIKETCKDLGMVIPEESIERFNSTIKMLSSSDSPKFDKSFQVLSFYKNFIESRDA
jgi:radical SAM superfamily enzyme YgiQ (UPF0313 family)